MEGLDLIEFDLNSEHSSIIKVIGVGGGGGNAVNHMFIEGIKDVNFIICNTDKQALERSSVKDKILLGSGLGAGNIPEHAREAAEESADEIRSLLSRDTKMLFITAGMGGGTGTGAAPVIAKIARELDILTVGIVTIPFAFEGQRKIAQALEGVRLMSENVDALLVINNERLRDIYPELDLSNAFGKADDVLKDAAKGIAEIITIHGHINVDFADVNTIMRNGGVAIMNTGFASGENRLRNAIDNALSSPLLKNNNIVGAKKILLNFYCRQDETSIKMDEIAQITEFMEQVGDQAEQVIWGISFDDNLEEEVKITLLATGFAVDDMVSPVKKKPLNITQTLLKEEPVAKEELALSISAQPQSNTTISGEKEEVISYEPSVDNSAVTINFDLNVNAVSAKESQDKEDMYNKFYGDTNLEQKKKAESFASKITQIDDEKVVEELENVPAYKRHSTTEGPKPFSF